MVEIEKLKYEIEVDTSTLGPQLALAQTQIGTALSDRVGVGMSADLPRPVGGIGIGDAVFAVGHSGNLAYQQSALFAQTASQDARFAQMGAVGAPVYVPTPVPIMMPTAAPRPSQMPAPGMGAMGFAPSVSVGPAALLFGGGLTDAAPWVTPEEEARAVGIARGQLGWDIAAGVGDLAAWGAGATIGKMAAGGMKLGLLGTGAAVLGGGFLASAVLAGGISAMRDVNRWGQTLGTYGVPFDDSRQLALEMQGYSSMWGVFGRGIMEGVDFTGLLQMERASRIAANYNLRSRAARDDPSFLLRQTAYGFAGGFTDKIYGDIKSQSLDYATAVDVIMTSMRVDEPQARDVAASVVQSGATIQSISALRDLDLYDPLVDTYMKQGISRPQAFAQVAVELPRMAQMPIARASGAPLQFARDLMASRGQVTQLYYGDTFGDAGNLSGIGITPNTILSDLSTLGGFNAQAPEAMGLVAAAMGSMDDPDPQTTFKKLAGLAKAGDIRSKVAKKVSEIQGGGTKEILRFYRNYYRTMDMARADPKVAYGLTMARIKLIEEATGMDTETAELYLETNAVQMGLDPSIIRAGLDYMRQMAEHGEALDMSAVSSVTPAQAMQAAELGGIVYGEIRLPGAGAVPIETAVALGDIAARDPEKYGVSEQFRGAIAITRGDLERGGAMPGPEVATALHQGLRTAFGLKWEGGEYTFETAEGRMAAAEAIGTNRAKLRRLSQLITSKEGVTAKQVSSWFKGAMPGALQEFANEYKMFLPEEAHKRFELLMTATRSHMTGKIGVPETFGHMVSADPSFQTFYFDDATRSATGVSGIGFALDELSTGIQTFRQTVDEIRKKMGESARPAENYK
jgi:hypothetical protein